MMMENDELRELETLRSYAELLEANAPVVALAMYCGATIGRAAPAGRPGQRMLAGLRVLADALNFEDASLLEVSRAVQSLSPQLASEINKGAAPAATEFKLDRNSVDEWRAALKRGIAVPDAPLPQDLLRQFQDLSKQLWKQRYVRYLEGDLAPAIAATAADLASLASEARFFQLVKYRWGEMTLRDWSKALLWSALSVEKLPDSRSSPDSCPPWLAVAAARGLGFKNILVELRDELDQIQQANTKKETAIQLNNEEIADLSDVFSRIPVESLSDPMQSLVIVQENGSIARCWQCTAKNTALLLTAAEYFELFMSARTLRASVGKFHSVLFELPIADGLVRDILGPMLEPDGRFCYIADERPREKLDAPLVTAPKDLDDAVSRGLKGWQRRARAKSEPPPPDESQQRFPNSARRKKK